MALNEPAERVRLISEFQQIIWHSNDLPESSEVEVLRDLAYDLDFYEPDVKLRAEDASFYGDDRIEDEIRAALKKLELLSDDNRLD